MEKYLILFGIWTPAFLSHVHSSSTFLMPYDHYHLATLPIGGKHSVYSVLTGSILSQNLFMVHLYVISRCYEVYNMLLSIVCRSQRASFCMCKGALRCTQVQNCNNVSPCNTTASIVQMKWKRPLTLDVHTRLVLLSFSSLGHLCVKVYEAMH